MMRLAPAIAFLALAACSCGTERAAPEHRTAAASPTAMCEEHGVLEALCTRCNRALIPVFRARGDFCEEHQLPESICPICHPERGGRPEAPLAIDDAPADGTRVRLASSDLADEIGLRVVAVARAPDAIEITATARIIYDAMRVARLNARSPGVLRAIHADVGARVEAGAPLLTIASADVAADRTRVSAARTRLEVAQANFDRREGLGEIVSQRDLADARRERDDARAELAALQASLNVVGGARRGADYVLLSPIAGVVTERTGSIGSFVESEQMLVEVVDPSRVWAELDVPDADLASVRPGLAVDVRVDGIEDRVFSGSLDYLAPSIDAHSRTARGRVPLANDDGVLRANMFARAVIRAPREQPAWRVPRAAVQRARGAALIFVRVADELYEVRRVEVMERAGDVEHVEVRGRISEADRVVVDGAFLLRTETLRDSIGAGCCEEAGD